MESSREGKLVGHKPPVVRGVLCCLSDSTSPVISCFRSTGLPSSLSAEEDLEVACNPDVSSFKPHTQSLPTKSLPAWEHFKQLTAMQPSQRLEPRHANTFCCAYARCFTFVMLLCIRFPGRACYASTHPTYARSLVNASNKTKGDLCRKPRLLLCTSSRGSCNTNTDWG